MVNKHDPLYQAFEKFSKFGIREVPLNYPPPGAASKKDPMIMDGARFAKLARDCGLIDHVKVDAAEVDLIFNKIKAKAERKINFEQFLSALLLLAKKKHSEQGIETLREMILACPGPVLGSVTTAVPPKFSALPRLSLDVGQLKAPKSPAASRHSLKPEQASASDGRSDERSIEMATGPSVFDRLTDTRSYTGTQKQKALEARLQGLHL